MRIVEAWVSCDSSSQMGSLTAGLSYGGLCSNWPRATSHRWHSLHASRAIISNTFGRVERSHMISLRQHWSD
jgi:hypothetical protein